MTIKIIQQNLDSRHKRYDKAYAEELMDKLLGENPNVLLLSEFCYACQKETVVQRLESQGYKIFLPCVPDEGYKAKDKYDSVCMIAVKKESLSFEQTIRKELGESNLRYIQGTLRCEEFETELLFVHVPQTYVPEAEKLTLPPDKKRYRKNIEYYQERMEYKAEMLFGAFCFWKENRDKCAFIGGDFNSETNGSTSLSSLFIKLYSEANDTMKSKEINTWKGKKRLDYALVSQSLLKHNCVTEPLRTNSDHLALMTTFEL